MRRRFFGKNLALALIAVPLLGGCVQTTRHSNTMIFGTNTVFGLDAGQSAGGIPNFTVGYRRQEAVIMPLVANSSDNGTYQTPCPVQELPDFFVGNVPPCLLVSRRGDAIDTYSVLASFGARFGGSGTDASASGGLAQFFATGLAAQFLAVNGGAALVAVSAAAEEQPNAGESTALQTLAASSGVSDRSLVVFDQNRTSRETAMGYLEGLDEQQFGPRFSAFATDLGIGAGYCTGRTKAACIDRLNTRSELVGRDAGRIDRAIAAARAVEVQP